MEAQKRESLEGRGWWCPSDWGDSAPQVVGITGLTHTSLHSKASSMLSCQGSAESWEQGVGGQGWTGVAGESQAVSSIWTLLFTSVS